MKWIEEISWRLQVPRWVLGCPECDREFTHSEIDTSRQPPPLDLYSWIGDKPEMPESGIRVECTHCKKVSLYKRYQLIYRQT